MNSFNITENQTGTSEALDVLLVQLAGELYALPSASVREVIRYRAYTPVPGAPPILPGILNQRGQILPLVELSPLLGLERTPLSRGTRLVMVSHTDIDMALLVDQVLDLTTLPINEIEPLPTALDPVRARYLRGIAHYDERPVAILELGEVIAGLRA